MGSQGGMHGVVVGMLLLVPAVVRADVGPPTLEMEAQRRCSSESQWRPGQLCMPYEYPPGYAAEPSPWAELGYTRSCTVEIGTRMVREVWCRPDRNPDGSKYAFVQPTRLTYITPEMLPDLAPPPALPGTVRMRDRTPPAAPPTVTAPGQQAPTQAPVTAPGQQAPAQAADAAGCSVAPRAPYGLLLALLVLTTRRRRA